jgi:peptide/nickel transport system permease protein
MVPTFVLITAVVFLAAKAAPGNPFSAARSTGEGAVRQMNPADYEAMLSRYGLDRPWYVQYGKWLGTLLSGSLGDSFSERRPVSEVLFGTGGAGKGFLGSPLGATLCLNGLALLLMAAVAVPVGLRSALRPGGTFDRVASGILYVLYSLPNFWIAVLLILLFGVKWNLLPFMGMRSDGYESLGLAARALDVLKHALLPAVCLAYGGMAFVARFTRGAVLEALSKDFVRVARAKGLSERKVLFHHAFRNALLPMLTLGGLLVPALVSGSVIVESLFAWPGLGQLYMKAVFTRDYPLILAESVLGAAVVLVTTLVVDLAYSAADPRVRHEP